MNAANKEKATFGGPSRPSLGGGRDKGDGQRAVACGGRTHKANATANGLFDILGDKISPPNHHSKPNYDFGYYVHRMNCTHGEKIWINRTQCSCTIIN